MSQKKGADFENLFSTLVCKKQQYIFLFKINTSTLFYFKLITSKNNMFTTALKLTKISIQALTSIPSVNRIT